MKSVPVILCASLIVLAAAPPARRALADDAAASGPNQQPQVVLTPQDVGGAKVPTTGEKRAKTYENDADMIGAGRALYAALNCNGCHAGGGGGFGPALSDDKWIYGGSLPNI